MRILISLGLCAVLWILQHIPLPGIDFDAMEAIAGDLWSGGTSAHFSLGALGILPYLSGYVVVELFHAALNWRKRREFQPRDRSRLTGWVFGVTVLLCLMQAFGIAAWLEGVQLPGGSMDGYLVSWPGWGFRLLVMITLCASTLFMVWLARLATQRGFGNGVAMLILYSLVSPIWRDLQELHDRVQDMAPIDLIVPVALLGALGYLILRFERWHVTLPLQPGEGALGWPLKGNPAGMVPRDWAATALIVPVSIAAMAPGMDYLIGQWHVGHPLYQVLFLALVVPFAWLYVRLTAWPARLNAMLERAGLSADNAESRICASRRATFWLGVAYLLALSVLTGLVDVFAEGFFLVHPATLLVFLVIVLDLKDELAFRRRAPAAELVLVEHEIHAARLLQAALQQQHQIPCHVQAYHLRSLVTFFGPFYELALWVPEDRAAKAREKLFEMQAPLS